MGNVIHAFTLLLVFASSTAIGSEFNDTQCAEFKSTIEKINAKAPPPANGENIISSAVDCKTKTFTMTWHLTTGQKIDETSIEGFTQAINIASCVNRRADWVSRFEQGWKIEALAIELNGNTHKVKVLYSCETL